MSFIKFENRNKVFDDLPALTSSVRSTEHDIGVSGNVLIPEFTAIRVTAPTETNINIMPWGELTAPTNYGINIAAGEYMDFRTGDTEIYLHWLGNTSHNGVNMRVFYW